VAAGFDADEPSAVPFLSSALWIRQRSRGRVRTLLLPPLLACAAKLRAREARCGWSSAAADGEFGEGGHGGARVVGIGVGIGESCSSIYPPRGRRRGRSCGRSGAPAGCSPPPRIEPRRCESSLMPRIEPAADRINS
jgi:hypothetical protein